MWRALRVGCGGEPVLYDRAAPVSVDETHRHTERREQLEAVEVADRAHVEPVVVEARRASVVAHTHVARHRPRLRGAAAWVGVARDTRQLGQRHARGELARGEEAEARVVVGLLDESRAVHVHLEQERHVALAAAHPHVTEEHVVQLRSDGAVLEQAEGVGHG